MRFTKKKLNIFGAGLVRAMFWSGARYSPTKPLAVSTIFIILWTSQESLKCRKQ